MFNSKQQAHPFSVAAAEPDARAAFIRRTYSHLAGAFFAFIALEAALLSLPGIENLVYKMIGGTFSWLIVLGCFMFVSYIAEKWANSNVSVKMQYAGLGLYIVAQAIIFVPLMFIAAQFDPAIIGHAGIITLLLFAGLTATVFITRKDFSFLKGFITMGFFVAIGVIIASMLFGFTLGLFFSGAMCLFAAATVLYSTSNVLHHYKTDQHVAASLSLFASVALLLWYVLQMLMSLSRGD